MLSKATPLRIATSHPLTDVSERLENETLGLMSDTPALFTETLAL